MSMPSSAPPRPDALPKPGDFVGPYRVVQAVGEGRSGVVYRARHQAFRTNQLLKVLRHRDSAVEQRLRVEVLAQQRLRHPNAVPFGGVIESNGVFALVIDPVNGPTLRELLHDGKGMPVDDALPVFAELLAGVHAAHRAGVLHLALTPDVIQLVTLPERVCPRISDFGLAGALQSLPAADSGGARYIAPELLESPTAGSTASDVFSLGVLLYEMVSGVPPFWGRARRGGRDGLPADVKPLRRVAPACPENVAEAVAIALQLRPDDRFPDCDAFARALFGDDFVLIEDDDLTDADQFDPKPEPTLPRPADFEALGELPSQPMLADVLTGKVTPARRGRPAAPTREPGPPVIVGRTVNRPGAASPPRPASPPSSSGPVGALPPAPPPTAAPPRVELPPPPAAASRAMDVMEIPVAPVDPQVARELHEMARPASSPFRVARMVFQYVVAPLLLVFGLLGLQAGWAAFQLGQARAQAAFASASVDARLAEAFDDVDRLVGQGAPAESLVAAVDAARLARTLPERVDALRTLHDRLARAQQVLPPAATPEQELERRFLAKSIAGLERDADAILASDAAVTEAGQAPLVEIGEALGFADGRPFGQDVAALRPAPKLLATVAGAAE